MGELYIISIGVGYTVPFRTFAAPWINAYDMTEKMNALNLPGVKFRPVSYVPYYAVSQGERCNGVQIHITDYSKVAVVDTENHSADLYAHLGDYKVLRLTRPFTPVAA